MNNAKYDVFLSYSRRDSSFVRSLAGALRGRGVRVWYDEGELRWGDTLLRQLEDALEHSRYYVLVISPDYVSSQWQSFETGVALTRQMSDRSERILPVFIGDLDLSVLPHTIASLTGLDAEKLSIEEIASSLAEVIKRDKERV